MLCWMSTVLAEEISYKIYLWITGINYHWAQAQQLALLYYTAKITTVPGMVYVYYLNNELLIRLFTSSNILCEVPNLIKISMKSSKMNSFIIAEIIQLRCPGQADFHFQAKTTHLVVLCWVEQHSKSLAQIWCCIYKLRYQSVNEAYISAARSEIHLVQPEQSLKELDSHSKQVFY